MKFKKEKYDIWESANKKNAKNYPKTKDIEITNNDSFFDEKDSIVEDKEINSIKKEKVTKEKPVKIKKTKKDKSKWKSSAIIGLAVLIVMMFLVIPFILIYALITVGIDLFLDVRENVGYSEQTEFTIIHEDSNEFLKNPTYYNEDIELTENYDEAATLNFTYSDVIEPSENDVDNNLWIETDQFYSGVNNFLVIGYDGNDIVWQTREDDNKIVLEQNGEENLFSLRMQGKDKYIAKDKDSDELVFSSSSDWFSFFAIPNEEDIVKNTNDFKQDYEFNNPGKTFNYGISGNPLNIKYTENQKYLNFNTELTDKTNINDQVSFEDEGNNNLFMANSNKVSSSENVSEEVNPIVLGNYKTLNFAPRLWDTETKSVTSDEAIWSELYYPTISVDVNGDVLMSQSLRSHQLEMFNLYAILADEEYTSEGNESLMGDKSTTDEHYSSEIWLIPNPNNWTQKFIFFPYAGESNLIKNGLYLDIDDDLNIVTNKLPENMDEETILNASLNNQYPASFEFEASPHTNPEWFQILPIFDNKNWTTFRIWSDNIDEVDTFTLNSYSSTETLNLLSEYNSGISDSNDLKEFYSNPYEVDVFHPKYTNGTQALVSGLETNETYVGTVTIDREDYDVSDHQTTIFIPFIYGSGFDINLPNWPIFRPKEDVDPTFYGMWDSTESGHVPDTEYVPNSEESPHGIDITEADDSAEISLTIQNGTGDGWFKKMYVELAEVDESGDLTGETIKTNSIYMSYNSWQAPEEYHLTATGLEPETSYVATLYLDGEAQGDTSVIPTTGETSEYQPILIETTREWPEYNEISTVENDGSGGSGTNISSIIEFTKWEDDDLIWFEITDGNGDEITDTGGYPTEPTQMSDFILEDSNYIVIDEVDGKQVATITMPIDYKKTYNITMVYQPSGYEEWMNDTTQSGDNYWGPDGTNDYEIRTEFTIV